MQKKVYHEPTLDFLLFESKEDILTVSGGAEGGIEIPGWQPGEHDWFTLDE